MRLANTPTSFEFCARWCDGSERNERNRSGLVGGGGAHGSSGSGAPPLLSCSPAVFDSAAAQGAEQERHCRGACCRRRVAGRQACMQAFGIVAETVLHACPPRTGSGSPWRRRFWSRELLSPACRCFRVYREQASRSINSKQQTCSSEAKLVRRTHFMPRRSLHSPSQPDAALPG